VLLAAIIERVTGFAELEGLLAEPT
jgi:hypothetical protein